MSIWNLVTVGFLLGTIVTSVSAMYGINDMIYVWPLAQGLGVTDIKSHTANGSVNNVQFVPSPAELDSYNAISFKGLTDSYVQIKILPYPLQEDLSLAFYAYFNNVTNGTIMEYRTDAYDENNLNVSTIQQFRLYIEFGNLRIELKGHGTHFFNEYYSTNIWYYIQIRRDVSKSEFTIYDVGGTEFKSSQLFAEISQSRLDMPGQLRVGADFSGTTSLNGSVTCLQWVPSKNKCGGFVEGNCNVTYWPSTTTSTTTTSTTTSTTTTSTTTSTTTAAPTTTTTTSTTAAPTTTSTTTTSTTTSTTTAAPTTTSTSTATPTTTTTSATTTTLQPLTIASEYVINNLCLRYRRSAMNATYGDTSDVIDQSIVYTYDRCAMFCNMNTLCYSFSMTSISVTMYKCKISSAVNPIILHDINSMLFLQV